MSQINTSSLETDLFQALDQTNNIEQLNKIKNDGKGMLKSDITDEQRIFILNTIALVNEILVEKKLEHLGEVGDQDVLKDIYQMTQDTSVQFITTVGKHTSQELREGFAEAIQVAENILLNNESRIPVKEFQEASELIEDMTLYGMQSLTQQKNIFEKLQDFVTDLGNESRILPTTGNGNCFYNAISTCDAILTGEKPKSFEGHSSLRKFSRATEKEAKGKRRITADYMKNNSGDMGINRRAYRSHEKNGVWAMDHQIRALVGAENRPILVIKYDPELHGEIMGTIYAKARGEGAHEVTPDNLRVIINYSNVHYDAMYTTLEAREELITKYNIVPVA